MTFSSMHRVAVLFLLGLSLLLLAPHGASAKVGQACGRFGPFHGPGSLHSTACDVGEFCDLTPGANACFSFISNGTCVRVQTRRCPGTRRPVCGCNGVTYPNDCTRIQAGFAKYHDGHC
jgi:hypothetical protein